MQATLDEMIQFTARQTKRHEDVFKTGDIYAGDELMIVDKYIDSFNYAMNKISRERYRPLHKEAVVIDENNEIKLSDLSKHVTKVRAVYHGINEIEWNEGVDFTLKFPSGAGTEVEVEYHYQIESFPNNPTAEELERRLDFPDFVDFRIICYYACYEYHLIKGSDRDLDKTGFFLSKFNDGYLHIPRGVKARNRVKPRTMY